MTEQSAALLQQGLKLHRDGDLAGARDVLLAAARLFEVPPAEVCVRLSRVLRDLGDVAGSASWAVRVVDATDDDYPAWESAAKLLADSAHEPSARRRLRVAVLGSVTTDYFTPLLCLAARRGGVALDVYEAPYGQYRQEILDPSSGLYRHEPDVVVLAVEEQEAALPAHAERPADAVQAEVERWSALWETVRSRSGARIVQHGFVVPPDPPLGHLTAGLPTSRQRLLQALNARLTEVAPDGVAIVDCDRVASTVGKRRWFDPRYWYMARLPVAFPVMPALALHTAAVLVSQAGLSRKCVVTDLDNTLWSGVVGEDGIERIGLGGSPVGEAHIALQEHLLALKERGMILAVCSKNDPGVARKPFSEHPDMRLGLDDFAAFVANWEPKSDNLRNIAAMLDLGLDAFVFLDDNPLERAEIRERLSDVEVVPLPPDPTGYVAALARFPWIEPTTFTREDADRTAAYRARAAAQEALAAAPSLEEFHAGLGMQAAVEAFTPENLPRIAQLVGKTNQFNLTTRRHSAARLEAFAADPACVDLAFRLRDRFTDHGLVSVVIALVQDEELWVDTWLMSCRVLGRTLERTVLEHLGAHARAHGCKAIVGSHLPTPKNDLVANLYADLGFEEIGSEGAATLWRLDVTDEVPPSNPYIETFAREQASDT